jgi:hypothetical protein
MLQAKHNSGIIPEQLNRPKRANIQLSHDYALKITFTKRQGSAESISKHIGSVLSGMP